MSRITLTVFLVLAITVGIFNFAYAKSSYTNSFNNFYGTSGTNNGSTLGSCITCHNQSNGNGGENKYGTDYRNYGHSFASIEPLDSDNDGFTNLEEIVAGYFPGNSSSHPAPTNSPPVADAGPNQTVNEGVTVTLDGSNSSDPDDGIASYLWTQIGGSSVTLSNTAAVKPTFTAPDVGPGGTLLTFRLRVTDNGGLQSTDTCTITVSWINDPPVADAGPDQTVNEGVLVTLDGSSSSDPDDGIASYSWTQTAGPSVALSNTAAVQPTFTSPGVGVGGVALTFTLTVTDGSGVSRTDTCNVNVTNGNLPPVADAGPNQTVNEWVMVTLDGSGSSDPDDGIASYLWAQTGGPSVSLSDNSDFQPTFTAPDVGPDGESLTFELTVTDNGNLKSTDTCIVNVSWVNIPPNADAGPDQTVDEGATVMLDGLDSNDPDGGQLTYLWEQTGGPSVTLSDVSAMQPTFVTPMVASGSTGMTFRLTVEDNGGLQASNSVSITVNDNGISGFPADVLTFQSFAGEDMGIKVESGGNLISLYAVDPNSIGDTTGKPENLIFGLIDLEIKADAPGATAIVTIYLPQQVPVDYGWYQYSSTAGWIDYSEGAAFNLLRDEVTLTLTDGGSGDDDGVTNGLISDPSGPGTTPLFSSLSISGNNWGGSGCFIETVGKSFSAETRMMRSGQFGGGSLFKQLLKTIFKEKDPVHATQKTGNLSNHEPMRTVGNWIGDSLDDMTRIVPGQGSRPIIAILVALFFLLFLVGATIERKDLGPNNT